MPIKIVDVPDPFSSASRLSDRPPPLIESDAYRQVLQELRRYCRGELSGRSFLIAGHRGAGKTTLVSTVFEALLRDPAIDPRRTPWEIPSQQLAASDVAASEFAGKRSLRPLPVLLQGPTLLPNAQEDLPLAVDGTGDANRRLTEMENVLVQITLGLHRAVAREMVLAFRAHVSRYAPQALTPDMTELAAQLQLELDDYTGRARLREMWRRSGALTFGVLYALRASRHVLYDGMRVDPRDIDPLLPFPDQGLRELLGVASVCEAYRRISGKISRKDERKSGATRKAESSFAVDSKGKEIAGPLIALLAGSAVGAGALAAEARPAVAALTGVLTAIAGTMAAKWSVTRTQDRSASLEDLFIPDLSVATMDRILPVLLDRLRDAGLAPVFVIDELDKVEGLSERILDMVRRLKKLVAENACFCFLADRSYFEEMRCRTARAPYSVEHTYFTYQFFIAFRHTDVRKYLEQILVRPVDDPKADPVTANRTREERADYDVLPYILVHSAQMHPIDLQRQITAWRGPGGNMILEPGLVRSRRRYQLELLIQLAIEWQLEESGMQEELDRRPAFRQLAHDAMYYISRRWEQDEDELPLEDSARESFERYLIGRMALEIKRGGPSQSSTQVIIPPPTGASEPRLVNPEDLRFLWSAVQALAQAIAAPASIQAEYEKRGTSEAILAPLREAVKLGALLDRTAGTQHTYRWKFRRAGRPVPMTTAPGPVVVAPGAGITPVAPAPPPAAPPTAGWQPQAAFIRTFEKALAAATHGTIDPSTLSVGLGILPVSPAWPQVSAALSRLETVSAAKTTYPAMEDDVAVVAAYVAMLESNVRAASVGLYCGLVLGHWSRAPHDSRLRDALEKMSHVLALHEARPESVIQILGLLDRGLTIRVFPRAPDDAADGRPAQRMPGDEADASHWIGTMAALATGVTMRETVLKTPVTEKAQKEAWEFWRKRLQGNTPIEALGSTLGEGATADDLAASIFDVVRQAVEGRGPFTLLKLPVDTMTLRDWSLAFFRTIAAEGEYPPPWLATAAVASLGWPTEPFVKLVSTVRGSPPSQAQSLPDPTANRPRPLARVLVASQPDALTESWKPDPVYPAIVLHRSEWAWLAAVSENPDVILDAFAADTLVVDMSAQKAVSGSRDGVLKKSAHKRALKPEFGYTNDEPHEFLEFFGSDQRVKGRPVVWILSAPTAVPLPAPYVPAVRPKSFAEALRSEVQQQM